MPQQLQSEGPLMSDMRASSEEQGVSDSIEGEMPFRVGKGSTAVLSSGGFNTIISGMPMRSAIGAIEELEVEGNTLLKNTDDHYGTPGGYSDLSWQFLVLIFCGVVVTSLVSEILYDKVFPKILTKNSNALVRGFVRDSFLYGVLLAFVIQASTEYCKVNPNNVIFKEAPSFIIISCLLAYTFQAVLVCLVQMRSCCFPCFSFQFSFTGIILPVDSGENNTTTTNVDDGVGGSSSSSSANISGDQNLLQLSATSSNENLMKTSKAEREYSRILHILMVRLFCRQSNDTFKGKLFSRCLLLVSGISCLLLYVLLDSVISIGFPPEERHYLVLNLYCIIIFGVCCGAPFACLDLSDAVPGWVLTWCSRTGKSSRRDANENTSDLSLTREDSGLIPETPIEDAPNPFDVPNPTRLSMESTSSQGPFANAAFTDGENEGANQIERPNSTLLALDAAPVDLENGVLEPRVSTPSRGRCSLRKTGSTLSHTAGIFLLGPYLVGVIFAQSYLRLCVFLVYTAIRWPCVRKSRPEDTLWERFARESVEPLLLSSCWVFSWMIVGFTIFYSELGLHDGILTNPNLIWSYVGVVYFLSIFFLYSGPCSFMAKGRRIMQHHANVVFGRANVSGKNTPGSSANETAGSSANHNTLSLNASGGNELSAASELGVGENSKDTGLLGVPNEVSTNSLLPTGGSTPSRNNFFGSGSNFGGGSGLGWSSSTDNHNTYNNTNFSNANFNNGNGADNRVDRLVSIVRMSAEEAAETQESEEDIEGLGDELTMLKTVAKIQLQKLKRKCQILENKVASLQNENNVLKSNAMLIQNSSQQNRGGRNGNNQQGWPPQAGNGGAPEGGDGITMEGKNGTKDEQNNANTMSPQSNSPQDSSTQYGSTQNSNQPQSNTTVLSSSNFLNTTIDGTNLSQSELQHTPAGLSNTPSGTFIVGNVEQKNMSSSGSHGEQSPKNLTPKIHTPNSPSFCEAHLTGPGPSPWSSMLTPANVSPANPPKGLSPNSSTTASTLTGTHIPSTTSNSGIKSMMTNASTSSYGSTKSDVFVVVTSDQNMNKPRAESSEKSVAKPKASGWVSPTSLDHIPEISDPESASRTGILVPKIQETNLQQAAQEGAESEETVESLEFEEPDNRLKMTDNGIACDRS